MRIGIPTEIKDSEYRVGLLPSGARELRDRGHEVIVQTGAGAASGSNDADYREQGATIVADADAVFAESELIVKVKEPQKIELARLREHHTMFTFLHLAADAELTAALLASRATCIAYETVQDERGRLPLLAPMSEVAGRIAAQAGAYILQRPLGGRGVLLGGVSGAPGAKVKIIGGGAVGANAAVIALGMRADVTIFDTDLDRLRELDRALDGRASTCYASTLSIEEHLAEADLLIGAVLRAGARAPHVVHREQLTRMKPGAVLVDVSIDQGGCFETSRPTTHSEPTYQVDGISHYCVTNMPGAVPVTSTQALTNATIPYVRQLADKGVATALADSPGFLKGLATHAGQLTSEPVALAQGRAWVSPEQALAGNLAPALA